MDIHKIDWSTMEWKQIRKGVEQKAFSGSGATVALHRLMPGHEPKPHSHPHEQIAYIMAGRIRFHIGEETHDVLTASQACVRWAWLISSGAPGPPIRVGTHPGSSAFEKTSGQRRATAKARRTSYNLLSA